VHNAGHEALEHTARGRAPAVIYAAKSTQDRHDSIPTQIDESQEMCDANASSSKGTGSSLLDGTPGSPPGFEYGRPAVAPCGCRNRSARPHRHLRPGRRRTARATARACDPVQMSTAQVARETDPAMSTARST
jgi:hypothetical protein